MADDILTNQNVKPADALTQALASLTALGVETPVLAVIVPSDQFPQFRADIIAAMMDQPKDDDIYGQPGLVKYRGVTFLTPGALMRMLPRDELVAAVVRRMR